MTTKAATEATGEASGPRPGERQLGFDPGSEPHGQISFIGRIRTLWSPGNCPGNISGARERGAGARIELDPRYAPGLAGLAPGQGLMLLYWMAEARRDLIVQAPRHVETPRGTFAIRSPHRPNPIALAAVTITAIDVGAGVVDIDAADCFDGTPLLDMKPWLPSLDIPAGATTP